jgi:hypothetical protein
MIRSVGRPQSHRGSNSTGRDRRRDRRALWQPGGTAYDGHCVFDQLNVDNSTFASWLVQLRLELQRARTANERNEVRRLFYRLVNESAERSAGEGRRGSAVGPRRGLALPKTNAS